MSIVAVALVACSMNKLVTPLVSGFGEWHAGVSLA